MIEDDITTVEVLVRLLVALCAGLVIGLERDMTGHAAGLRTHILVAVGSALFTICGAIGGNDTTDPTRMAAQVVSGIGFLGAGAILHEGQGLWVRGLTTAASLWATAAMGVGIGLGAYIAVAFTVFLVLSTLQGLQQLENRLFYSWRIRTIIIDLAQNQSPTDAVMDASKVLGNVEVIAVSTNVSGTVRLRLATRPRKGEDLAQLTELLIELPGIAGVEMHPWV